MIVRGRPTVRDVLFATQGSILPRIIGPLLFIVAVSIVATGVSRFRPNFLANLSAIPFTLIGLSLSIFMSFRNTACYERWWEGRKLWGQLTIASRSFARQIALLPMPDRAFLLKGICGFATGLCARLRDTDEQAAIARYVDLQSSSAAPNLTAEVLARVGRRCLQLEASGSLNSVQYSVLDQQLSALAQVQGGCERIRQTPLPFSYSLLLHRTAHAFCLILPFALAPTLGWWTPLPTVLVGYAFFGLDALGDELSDPFGTEPNDLPLDAMVRTIEREMLFACGGEELPPALLPQGFKIF